MPKKTYTVPLSAVIKELYVRQHTSRKYRPFSY